MGNKALSCNSEVEGIHLKEEKEAVMKRESDKDNFKSLSYKRVFLILIIQESQLLGMLR